MTGLAIRNQRGRWQRIDPTKSWINLWGKDPRAWFNRAHMRIKHATGLALVDTLRVNQKRMDAAFDEAFVPVCELIGQTQPFNPFDTTFGDPT